MQSLLLIPFERVLIGLHPALRIISALNSLVFCRRTKRDMARELESNGRNAEERKDSQPGCEQFFS